MDAASLAVGIMKDSLRRSMGSQKKRLTFQMQNVLVVSPPFHASTLLRIFRRQDVAVAGFTSLVL